MATLYPSFEKILTQKVKPTEGELHLLKFLDSNLDNSFEVYFNPYMNGDRPDIVVLKEKQGVLIIEVKDYNLDLYVLNDKKQLVIKKSNTNTFKSPVSQVLKYKDNLFDLHIEKLLEKKIKNIRYFNIVSSAIYFHNSNSYQIKEVFVNPFEYDHGYQKFLKYNIDFIGRDNLNKMDLEILLKKRYLISEKPSFLFTDEIFQSFKRFLSPPIHLKEQGKEIRYSKKQLQIIYDSTRKEQRIKGVVGSGKTTVLAARAVQAYKRTQGRVLILTYNITLKNYIKDKLNDVREDFPWNCFTISSYHLFINSELNNLGLAFKLDENFDKLTEEQKSNFLEKEYYSNKDLFLDNKEYIKPYDVILIDEIQDYKREWMEIIKECFLAENGEYYLFGDVKQNIYNNKTESKDISTNVRGVTELKDSFRSEFKIKDLAILYQKEIFKDKYEIDDFDSKLYDLEIPFERNQEGSVKYIFLQNIDNVSSLYTIIHENAINKNIPTNDITILGNSINLLKKFEAYYRYSSNEKTNTMFETNETIYTLGFNFLSKDLPIWLKEAVHLIKRGNDWSNEKAFNQLSILLTLYDLYTEYPSQFKVKLEIFCNKYSTNFNDFITFIEKYKSEIDNFKKDFSPEKLSKNLKAIRNNKKIHFYMNSGTVKLSTIHSFKGWESETIFLILEKMNFQMTFDEILYTGLTRSRANLILINYGNLEYHNKLKDLIDKIK
ncbi:nuclease-related domain-containing DEAD/DEAH box helicase [Flavobacterium oreochromis]|uniref:nuclease-related domain-containing DEAD/DEAH box helicase n=1 Tax=Flavobacterium oreochromis TaxID=2906078 RepID=UPI000B4CC267|nr:NERD domain-containing protein [Flavobacterium oreochromis]OWP75496.1 nuclease [Flavobacterium oreochromis]